MLLVSDRSAPQLQLAPPQLEATLHLLLMLLMVLLMAASSGAQSSVVGMPTLLPPAQHSPNTETLLPHNSMPLMV
jgi:hypothetical protein